MALTSKPIADVTIDISSSNIYEGTVSTFHRLPLHRQLDVPRTVTVTGVNNGIIEGDVYYTHRHRRGRQQRSELQRPECLGCVGDQYSTPTLTIRSGWIRTTTCLDGTILLRWSALFYNRGRTGRFRSARRSRRPIIQPTAPAANDRIYFNLPSGSHTINVTSPLPNITDGVTIDGTTDSHFAGTPIIELNGANAGTTTIGINIRCPWNVIRGLVINRFARDGI